METPREKCRTFPNLQHGTGWHACKRCLMRAPASAGTRTRVLRRARAGHSPRSRGHPANNRCCRQPASGLRISKRGSQDVAPRTRTRGTPQISRSKGTENVGITTRKSKFGDRCARPRARAPFGRDEGGDWRTQERKRGCSGGHGLWRQAECPDNRIIGGIESGTSK